MRQRPTSRATGGLPANSAAVGGPRPSGGNVSQARAWPACKTPLVPADRRSFPPSQRLHVVELATTEDPAAAGCPVGSWSLDDLALTILRQANEQDLLLARLAFAHEAAAGAMLEEEMATLAALLPPLDLRPMSRSIGQPKCVERSAQLSRPRSWIWRPVPASIR